MSEVPPSPSAIAGLTEDRCTALFEMIPGETGDIIRALDESAPQNISLRTLYETLACLPHNHSGHSTTSFYTIVPDAVPFTEPTTATVAPGNSSADTLVPIQAFSPADYVPGEQRWYAIIVGRNPGVYQGSHHVPPNTNNIPGYVVQRHNTEALAREAYDTALDRQEVIKVEFYTIRTIVAREIS
ncbi:hypothetical protein DXG01_015686 [Tephrocybe rancida]|nr:hypothetical protein DXG01_015686 [Tephrocybe rancida]